MPYTAPVADIRHVLERVVGFSAVAATQRFAEVTPEMVEAILTEAGRVASDVIAPLQRIGDTQPARLENGVVRMPDGFKGAWDALSAGGWLAMSASPAYGGLGLPMTLTSAVNEFVGAACLSLQLMPLMSQGQIEALEHHASEALKQVYLPKLISGEWAGTMNLTEPQAGSDVGALSTAAIPNGDGTYAVTGQKIYITGGDHDLVSNICHLVLARLPGGGAGTKGISLFMVPKRIPDATGAPGVANTLAVVSLEHKLGQAGCPTAVMHYSGATGWLVGQPHQGMRAMFTMMNNARLGVGMQGIAVAEAATQHALAYARERRQGNTQVGGGNGAILDHADVRRMLACMKADTLAARIIAMECAVAIDMATATGKDAWHARAALLTPIAKAYGTDVGISVADTGIQVHGGMGYIEDSGAAQFLRDVRVTAIYEGTNGIQAMDLVGRKLADGGAAAYALMDEMAGVDHPALNAAVAALRRTTVWVLDQPVHERNAGAVSYLAAFARILGAWGHLRSAKAGGKYARLAQIYVPRALPEAHAELAKVLLGTKDLYALSADDLAA
jgi:acyl-CoA dehydrogenase